MYRGVTALQFPPFLLPLIFINITGHCSDASTSTQPLLGHLLEFSASVIGTVFSCYAIGTFARARGCRGSRGAIERGRSSHPNACTRRQHL